MVWVWRAGGSWFGPARLVGRTERERSRTSAVAPGDETLPSWQGPFMMKRPSVADTTSPVISSGTKPGVNRPPTARVMRRPTPAAIAFAAASGSDGNRSQQPVRVRKKSEEHTAELQSLKRISSAVFCLKTKNKVKAEQQNKNY